MLSIQFQSYIFVVHICIYYRDLDVHTDKIFNNLVCKASVANYLLSSETVFPVFVWILSSIMTQLSKGKKNWFDWKWHLATVVCVIFLIVTIGHKPQREWRKIQKEQIFITFWLWCSFFFFPVACADPIWRCNFRLMPKLYLLAEHF